MAQLHVSKSYFSLYNCCFFFECKWEYVMPVQETGSIKQLFLNQGGSSYFQYYLSFANDFIMKRKSMIFK